MEILKILLAKENLPIIMNSYKKNSSFYCFEVYLIKTCTYKKIIPKHL